MKIRQLLKEAGGITAAFAFGRFNPAHQGHIAVWQTVEKSGVKWYIGTNPTTIGPNDPLTFDQKKAWMEEIYPQIQGHIVPEQSVVTLAVKIYNDLGKNEDSTIGYVTDDTDWAWSGKLLNQYNGVEGKHGYYKFAQIVHIPSPRVSSATALRDAARADDKAAFYHASGTDPKLKVSGKTYFDTVAEACAKYPLPVKKAKKTESLSESAGNVGDTIRQLYQQIYDQGDDALEYLNTSAPLFAQYWDQYEGDLDSIIAELSTKNLIRIAKELQQVAGAEGVSEGWIKLPNGNYRNMHTGVTASKPPVKKKRGEKTGAEWDAIEKAKKDKEQGVAEGSKKIPASNKPVDPKDLVVSLKDVPVKKPRGHKQYDPANEFPGVKVFKKQGVAEGETEYGPEWDEMVKRLGQRAKQGPLKTVYDEKTGKYKNVPVNEPKKDLAEMDSQGHTGSRDHKRTSKYGTRDDYNLSDPEITLGPDSISKPNDVAKKASAILSRELDKAYDKDDSAVIADMAKKLTNPPKVMQHRAQQDQKREEQLKYRDIAKRNESIDEANEKVHLRTPKHGMADHSGRDTGVSKFKFGQTPEENRCPKCNSLFKAHYRQHKEVEEASLSAMRDYFSGDGDGYDPLKITQMRQHYGKEGDVNSKRKEFRSEWEYQQWMNKNKLKTISKTPVKEEQKQNWVQKIMERKK